MEATETISGLSRTPLRNAWYELTGLCRPQLRVITANIGGNLPGVVRQQVQSNFAMPLLLKECDSRIIILADSDEFLEEDAVKKLFPKIEKPGRMGLVPLYGAIDRVARSIHCCIRPKNDYLRDPAARLNQSPYLLPGPLIAHAKDLRTTAVGSLRLTSKLIDQAEAVGYHLTMVEPVAQVSIKLDSLMHHWVDRVKCVKHLETMLSVGVHHAGWWIAEYRRPEPWLVNLAKEADLRIAGTPKPESHLSALRAWAEARLDPNLPDSVVKALDQYVARRGPNTMDFLNDLDKGQLKRPIIYHGHKNKESLLTL